ncbi:MAG TPA: TolC family protein [Verrucomicrobiae bacterium]|nr:TolC family protein [Verrucomicrobiae bacterium]
MKGLHRFMSVLGSNLSFPRVSRFPRFLFLLSTSQLRLSAFSFGACHSLLISAAIVFLALAAGRAQTTNSAQPMLTLAQAHEVALRNHPQISVADLKALAARQVVREVRSGFFPNLSLNAVAVGASDPGNTRLEAVGALNSPRVFDRNAEGLMLSQLITDFGRTANLTGSARQQAEAAANNAQATRQQILLAVDSTFFSALQAQAVVHVAEQTITNRQLFLDQVTALASNRIKSEMDVSFANVNLDDARLLLVRAINELQSSFTQLGNLLGQREPANYRLADEPLPPMLDTNVSDFVQQALNSRPDLLSLRNQQAAAIRMARAERDARFPTISAVAAAGVAPVHDETLPDNYAAAGLVANLPIFAGGLYVARQREAELQAEAARESLRDLEDNVIRDVRVAWLNAQNAFERYRITGRLVENARYSYELAQARYTQKLSSIVEVNQAELNLISAQIDYLNSQYEYLGQRSALSYQTGQMR